MRKSAYCICKNKGAAADQHLCFRYIDCAISLLPKPLTTFCGCTARFVFDLVGNPKDRFSRKKGLNKHWVLVITDEFFLSILP